MFCSKWKVWIKFWASEVISLIELKRIIDKSWCSELILGCTLTSFNQINILFYRIERENFCVAHIHIQISLFSNKHFCSSALRVIHFMWYFCKQLQHFRLYEWLWTRFLQTGQHVMVLTRGIKHPFLHSTIEIDHKIATESLLNYSNPPVYNIQNDHCIYPSKHYQHKQHRVQSEMSA